MYSICLIIMNGLWMSINTTSKLDIFVQYVPVDVKTIQVFTEKSIIFNKSL